MKHIDTLCARYNLEREGGREGEGGVGGMSISLNFIESINLTGSGGLGDSQLFTGNNTCNNVHDYSRYYKYP